MTLRIGSLCTGYGGLDMAVESVLGGDLAWVADIDPGASAILAHRFPSLPNLGDISKTDWGAIDPVDILCAGFPCQDVSCAGARAGMREGNRTGVWAYVARAIGELRPPLVVLENVRGLLTFGADSNLEPCPWCMGDSGDESVLRACGAVLADLADLGFDAEWALVSAAEVGAPHRRERVFIIAWPAADAERLGHGRHPGAAGETDALGTRPRAAATGRCPGSVPHPDRAASGERRISAPGETESGRSRADAGGRGGAPAADTCGERLEVGPVEHHGPEREATERGSGDDAPADADHRDGKECPARGYGPGGRSSRSDSVPADAPGDGRDEWRPEPAGIVGGPDAAVCGDGAAADTESERHGYAGPQGQRGIPAAAVTGAPADPHGQDPGPYSRGGCAAASAGPGDGQERRGEPGPGIGDSALADAIGPELTRERESRRRSVGRDAPAGHSPAAIEWGVYELAVRRWEASTGRPAPRPTEPGRTGERLSPAFVEWMMGLPEGWVTDVPGLSRNAQLKALGNGVVPQQAAAALRLLLDRTGIAPLVGAGTALSEAKGAA